MQNMSNHKDEIDFIGGEKPLTKAEELALSQYFLQKKSKDRKTVKSTSKKKKSKLVLQSH
jgi:hypothetical protein